MRYYSVTIPVSGYIVVEVKADDKEAAKKSAWEQVDAEGEDAGEFAFEFCDKLFDEHGYCVEVEVELQKS